MMSEPPSHLRCGIPRSIPSLVAFADPFCFYPGYLVVLCVDTRAVGLVSAVDVKTERTLNSQRRHPPIQVTSTGFPVPHLLFFLFLRPHTVVKHINFRPNTSPPSPAPLPNQTRYASTTTKKNTWSERTNEPTNVDGHTSDTDIKQQQSSAPTPAATKTHLP